MPIVLMKCPNCGRMMEKNVATGDEDCHHCGYNNREAQVWNVNPRTLDAQRGQRVRRRLRRP